MQYTYNPNWDSAKGRFANWWNGTNTGRPLLQVLGIRARQAEPLTEPPQPVNDEQRWMDADYRMDQFEYEASWKFYGGDAVPYFDPHLGPGQMALYLGCKPDFEPATVWFSPVIEDVASAPLPEFDPENKFFRWSLDTASRARGRFAGRSMVAIPDLVEGLDVLASMVGTERLLMYLIDSPGHVHRFLERINELYFSYYDPLYEASRDESGGSCFSAFSFWGPGRTAKVQCDFSAMISRDMFREFVQPYLREQCARLDYPVYHWDGPGAVQHLDAILEIDEIRAVQWTPSPGTPGPGDRSYWHLYHPIVSAGKSLMLCGVTGDEVQPLLDEFGPDRLNITVWCWTQAEAEAILERFL